MLPYWKSQYFRPFAAAVPEFEDNGKPNRSAYFWDAGLWTACIESRKTIMSCTNMNFWYEKKGNVINKLPGEKWEVEDFLEEHANISTITRAPPMIGDGEDWHLVVRPYQDAIKPTQGIIHYWLRHSHRASEWRYLLMGLPFSADYTGIQSIKNIVLEFDASWSLDWSDYYSFFKEVSLRRFVYEMVWQVAYEYSDCYIWLIDRGESLPYKPAGEDPPVFYDCDDEYVEAYCGARRGSAESFILHLDQFVYEWREDVWMEELTPGVFDRGRFHTTDQIGVLRPRKLLEGLQ